MSPDSGRIYHLATLGDWVTAGHAGVYFAPSLDPEGFCHCSFRHQLASTARRYFRGVPEAILLVIRVDRLDARVAVEDLAGKGEAFPHVYGPIPMEAIEASHVVKAGPDGHLVLPPLG